MFRPDYVPWTVAVADKSAAMLKAMAVKVVSFGDRLMGARPRERILKMRRLVAFGGVMPQIGANCFIAPSAVVIGNVRLGRKSSVCYNAVVRGDDSQGIEIGEGSCINDKAIVKGNTVIGRYVCIDPMAIVDSAHVASNSMVGAGSIVCRGATMESGSMLCAASVLRSGAIVPSGEMWSGNPAQKIGDLSEQEKDFIIKAAKHQILLAVEHSDAWSYNWDEIENHRLAREVWGQWAQSMIEFRIKPFYVRAGPSARMKKDNPLDVHQGMGKFQGGQKPAGFD